MGKCNCTEVLLRSAPRKKPNCLTLFFLLNGSNSWTSVNTEKCVVSLRWKETSDTEGRDDTLLLSFFSMKKFICLGVHALCVYTSLFSTCISLKFIKKNYEYLNITSFQLSFLVANESFAYSRSIIFQIHIFYFSDLCFFSRNVTHFACKFSLDYCKEVRPLVYPSQLASLATK